MRVCTRHFSAGPSLWNFASALRSPLCSHPISKCRLQVPSRSRKRAMALPKLLAFDLDATIWIPEMYELDGPPFKVDKSDPRFLLDRSGERIRLMGDTRRILAELASHEQWAETQVAYVSRTEYPHWANTCLQLFHVEEGVNLHGIAVHHEIYPGSKRTHFRRIHERTKIAYEDMLFFDNEHWNVKDVAPMGVTSVYCPQGLTLAVWEQGLAKHRQRKRPQ